ncbi:hypothetical protein TcWFU_004920 [Taenia crassiceps]|uniref:Uncharacterized protein n=1 Tax=Taenia crassiceps TaxID=6207 RepID=A0ABR4QKH5_9CEST
MSICGCQVELGGGYACSLVALELSCYWAALPGTSGVGAARQHTALLAGGAWLISEVGVVNAANSPACGVCWGVLVSHILLNTCQIAGKFSPTPNWQVWRFDLC